jgi:3-hydroxy-9,10-secoandrosta-1,3,5(10)-triene-9,17-dione monooxygenase
MRIAVDASFVDPGRVGGAELDYVALVDCADALGQADASVAWNFANLASHHWMLGMFDPQAQDAIWSFSINRPTMDSSDGIR